MSANNPEAGDIWYDPRNDCFFLYVNSYDGLCAIYLTANSLKVPHVTPANDFTIEHMGNKFVCQLDTKQLTLLIKKEYNLDAS